MTENSSGGKTHLALDTKLNYARLAKHLVWMEKRILLNPPSMIIKSMYPWHW
ncbi:hypothetical protein NMT12_60076 [metagenome]